MRTFKLLLPGDQSITFTNKWWQELRSGNIAGLIIFFRRLAFLILAGFVLVLPFILTMAPTVEFRYAYYLIFVVLALLGITLISSLLGGWKYLVDPQGLVGILSFALVSIFAYLFANATLGNTLGSTGGKYLGAIYLMVLIGLFYFTALFLSSVRRVRLMSIVFLISLASLLLVKWMLGVTTIVVESNLLNMAVQNLLVLATGVWLLGCLYASGMWRLFSFAFLVVSVVLAFDTNVQTTFNGWVLLVNSLLLIIGSVAYLRKSKWKIKNITTEFIQNIKTALRGKLKWTAFPAKSEVVIWLSFTILWIVLTIAWFVVNKLSLQIFGDLFTEYRNAISYLTDFQKIFVGTGASISLSGSTFASVISYQGILGTLAFGILLFTALRLGLAHWISAKTWQLKSIAVVVVGISLSMLVTRVYILPVILWWLGLGILSVSTASSEARSKISQLKKIRILRWTISRHVVKLQILLTLALIIAWVVAINWIWFQAQAGKI